MLTQILVHLSKKQAVIPLQLVPWSLAKWGRELAKDWREKREERTFPDCVRIPLTNSAFVCPRADSGANHQVVFRPPSPRGHTQLSPNEIQFW